MDARWIGFGTIEVEGRRYDHDIVIDAGAVSKRTKKASKRYREQYGHTPLSADERIPWGGGRLIVGTGAYGSLPVTPELEREAARRHVQIVALPTPDALRLIADLAAEDVRAVIHVTC
jgi:hypothetical protein